MTEPRTPQSITPEQKGWAVARVLAQKLAKAIGSSPRTVLENAIAIVEEQDSQL